MLNNVSGELTAIRNKVRLALSRQEGEENESTASS